MSLGREALEGGGHRHRWLARAQSLSFRPQSHCLRFAIQPRRTSRVQCDFPRLGPWVTGFGHPPWWVGFPDGPLLIALNPEGPEHTSRSQQGLLQLQLLSQCHMVSA